MNVSTKNIKKIKKRLDCLYGKFNIQPSIEEIKIGDEFIFINFPDEWDEEDFEYSVDDFLNYTEDIENIKVVDNHSVICGNVRQTIVHANNYYYEHRVPQIQFDTNEVSIKIIDNPFLIGIVSARDGIYNGDFGVFPCSDYMAIELRYKGKVNEDEEHNIELIKKCLYYIASKYGVPVSIGQFRSWDDITDEEPPANIVVGESSLLPYSSAMDYYIKALTIENVDIKYLHFYKIIEYFAPVVSKRHSYEQLNQRLDILHITDRSYEYLDSIFKLTKQYEISLKDKELTFTVLSECVDIVTLFEYLPDNLQKSISKNCKFAIKDIAILKQTEINEIKREIGNMLYATRNSIVHAKSNYSSTGKECLIEDLEQLNIFMLLLCDCLIVWNGRQSKEYQLK